jgi:hypothetical protein
MPPCPSWLTTIAPEWLESMKMNRAFFTHTAPILAPAIGFAPSTGLANIETDTRAQHAARLLLWNGVPIDAWWPLRLFQPAGSADGGAHTLLAAVISRILQQRFQLTWSEPCLSGTMDRITNIIH